MTTTTPGAIAPRPSWGRVARTGAVPVVGLALLWCLLPRVTGAPWGAVLSQLGTLSPGRLAVLTAVWFAGLYLHSYVLTGALPGLTHRRALTLNMTGSAVSNVAPLGGALGVALNLAMVTRWQFTRPAYAAFAITTNVWDVAAKLALPSVALVTLTVTGAQPSGSLYRAALVAGVVLALVVAAVVLVLSSRRAMEALADRLGRLSHLVQHRRSKAVLGALPHHLRAARADIAAVVRRSGAQMTAGMAGYLALQACLMWLCLHAVGAGVGPTTVLAVYAVERVLSLVVVTPGGTGLAEAGAAGVLVAMGVDPVGATAGVLLYRTFTFALEVPVGGVWLGGWLLAQRRRPAPMEVAR